MQIIIQGPLYGQPQPVRLCVDGEQAILPVNKPVECSEALLLALRDSDHIIRIVGDTAAEEEAPAGSGDGGEGSGGDSPEPAAVTTDPVPPSTPQEPELEAPAEGFLDRSVTAIVAELDGLRLSQLRGLRAAEDAGKTRKSLVAAIDERIAALTAA